MSRLARHALSLSSFNDLFNRRSLDMASSLQQKQFMTSRDIAELAMRCFWYLCCAGCASTSNQGVQVADGGTGGAHAGGGSSSGGHQSSSTGGRPAGSPGTGGRAQTGGADAGGRADTGTGAGDADAAACIDCLSGYITWSMHANADAYMDSSRIDTCRAYSHESVTGATDSGAVRCATNLPECPAGTIGEIRALLESTVVKDALSSRASFGFFSGTEAQPIFTMKTDAGYVVVGAPCPDAAAGCSPVPAAIRDLMELLQSLDRAQLLTDPCKTAFAH